MLVGTALITALAVAGAKSMKEAQSHIMWLMMLPMLPAYDLMAYPDQGHRKVVAIRGAVPVAEPADRKNHPRRVRQRAVGVYFATSLALGAVLCGCWRCGATAGRSWRSVPDRSRPDGGIHNEKARRNAGLFVTASVRLLLERDRAAGGGGLRHRLEAPALRRQRLTFELAVNWRGNAGADGAH